MKEIQPLRNAGIRVLSIVRQTQRVARPEIDGSADAVANAQDILATFGAAYLGFANVVVLRRTLQIDVTLRIQRASTPCP